MVFCCTERAINLLKFRICLKTAYAALQDTALHNITFVCLRGFAHSAYMSLQLPMPIHFYGYMHS